MRKATGLIMRSELAMAISEVYKEFIEVRSVSLSLCVVSRHEGSRLENAQMDN